MAGDTCKTEGTDNLMTNLKIILPPDAKTTFTFSKKSQRKISVYVSLNERGTLQCIDIFLRWCWIL